MIVQVTPEMLPKLLPMCGQFHEASGALGEFCPDLWVDSWTQYLDAGAAFILCQQGDDGDPVGMIGGFLTPDASDGALVAQEAFWFVDPRERGIGLGLLDAFLSVAETLGAKRVMLTHTRRLKPKALGRLYRRMGFKPFETMYAKELV